MLRHHFAKPCLSPRTHGALGFHITSNLTSLPSCCHLALHANLSTHLHIFFLQNKFPPPCVFCKHLKLSDDSSLCSLTKPVSFLKIFGMFNLLFHLLLILEPECWEQQVKFYIASLGLRIWEACRANSQAHERIPGTEAVHPGAQWTKVKPGEQVHSGFSAPGRCTHLGLERAWKLWLQVTQKDEVGRSHQWETEQIHGCGRYICLSSASAVRSAPSSFPHRCTRCLAIEMWHSCLFSLYLGCLVTTLANRV